MTVFNRKMAKKGWHLSHNRAIMQSLSKFLLKKSAMMMVDLAAVRCYDDENGCKCHELDAFGAQCGAL